MLTEEFIKNMPKVELHAHLNGSLSTKTLLELGALFYGQTTDEYHRICDSFKNFNEHSLSECFKKFQIAHDLTTTKNGLKKATECVIRDFAQDNVVYLELRTTLKKTLHMSKSEYIQCVLDGISSANHSFPNICVKLIPSINRSEGKECAEETVSTVIEKLSTYSDVIKGLDLSGNPASGTFEEYREILEIARSKGLKLTLHCAEIKNDEETRQMLDFGMDRCGHGTYILDENLSIARNKQIPIECCLSSNIKCGTVNSFEDHHFKNLYKSNYPVVLCTDDFGVFNTSLSNEFIIAKETFNFSKVDLQKLSLNAVNASFANSSEKEFLNNVVQKYFI